MTQITVDVPDMPRPIGFTRTDLALMLMVLIWGVNYIVLKAVMRDIEPIAFNAAAAFECPK